jgi:hypothetical protein
MNEMGWKRSTQEDKIYLHRTLIEKTEGEENTSETKYLW